METYNRCQKRSFHTKLNRANVCSRGIDRDRNMEPPLISDMDLDEMPSALLVLSEVEEMLIARAQDS
jgi:hypothetical protein